MAKTGGKKWNVRVGKWTAALLATVLLVGLTGFSALAEESREEVCRCVTRCNGDSVNEACVVCAEDYGRCEGDTDSDVDAASDMGTDDVGEYDFAVQAAGTEKTDGEAVASTASVGDSFEKDGFRYEIINEDEGNLQVKILKCVDTSISGTLEIPSTVSYGTNEYTVVDIEEYAFEECSGLTSVVIPGSFTSIGEYAFARCSGLASVTILDGVTSIGEYAFWECSGLTSVIIPESVTSIGEDAFWGCSSLTSITIPENFTNIGAYAFAGSGLASFTIPDSVTSIGMGAFNQCHGLTSVTIPDSVTSIGMVAFWGCSSLTGITIPDGITSIEWGTFGDCEKLENIIIPDSVTSIGDSTFWNCSSLTNIRIPEKLTSIGVGVFYRCSSLTSITIPENVTSIGPWAFAYCQQLESVTLLNDKISLGEYAFYTDYSLNSLKIFLTENHMVNPPTVENKWCFAGCSARSLIFVTKNGEELSDATTPTLAEAVKAYDAAYEWVYAYDEEYMRHNGMWHGWKLPDASDIPDVPVTGYPVTIRVKKDGSVWSDCPKRFALSPDDGVTFITDLDHVANGTYIIYETEAEDGTGYGSTGVSVEVNGAAVEDAEVDYYTVTFYNDAEKTEEHVLDRQIVLKGVKVGAPSDHPERDGYAFGGWFIFGDDGTVFDAEVPITAKTDIYARWMKDEEIPPVTEYPVTIHVNKDGIEWSGCPKKFALSSDGGVTFITDFDQVSNGTYIIYETEAEDGIGYGSTGVRVEVEGDAAKAGLDYYTVTFYNDDAVFREQIVLDNGKAGAPLESPTKDGYTFYRWVVSKGDSTEFDFGNPITAKTDIYASWIRAEEETFTIMASAGSGGSVSPSGDVKVKSGENQQFTITPEEGYQIASVLVDGSEVISGGQTGKQAKAGMSDGENNIKYYVFENVTGGHTLSASFKAADTGDKDPDVTGGYDNDGGKDPDVPGSGGNGGGKKPAVPGGDNGSGGSSGDNTSGNSNAGDSDSSITVILSDMNVGNDAVAISTDSPSTASNDKEPKTGDASHTEIYATTAMIAGVFYIALYFADRRRGMTEEERKRS